ncbi:CHAD domain-containing protein [Vogesella indigofera]|uniref:CHAD domain-containing protein n=1 Tax=Vogesella indigofera TaxID=45465 RepID=UPI00234E587A|nr:CHAD domain-containing protein [Vogesella indigofera]MDC7697397.1 CHAD domain-containing protein [Vogesella indigofera]
MSASARRILKRRLARYRRDILLARQQLSAADNGEALHQLRIGLRQLRSLLRGLMALPGATTLAQLSAQLRQLAAAGNDWRDREVRLALLQQAAGEADSKAFSAWRRREVMALQTGRLDLQQQAMVLDQLLPALRRACAPLLAYRNRRLRRTLRRALLQTRRRYRRARRDWQRQPGDALLAHRLRLLAKRLRYQIEAGGKLLGQRWRRRAQRARDWQQQLGDERDRQLLLQSIARDRIPLPVVARRWLEQGASANLGRLLQAASAS